MPVCHKPTPYAPAYKSLLDYKSGENSRITERRHAEGKAAKAEPALEFQ